MMRSANLALKTSKVQVTSQDADSPNCKEEARHEVYSRGAGSIFSAQTSRVKTAIANNVHNAGDEKQGHQSPTAAGAKCAVFQSHSKCAPTSLPPARHDEFQRAAAMGETSVLQRAELKNASPSSNVPPNHALVLIIECREQRVPMQPPLRGGGEGAKHAPNGDIARNEDRHRNYGCPSRCRLRVTAAKVRIIGSALGSIIAIIMMAHMKNSGSNVAAAMMKTPGRTFS